MDVVSRLTDVVPLGGRDRTSNPSWPRGAPPVGASRRDFTHLAAPGEDPVGRPSTGVRIPPPPRDVGPYEPVSHWWPGPEMVRAASRLGPEVGLGVLVGADVGAVDEFVEELLDHVGAVVSDGSPRPFVDATAS